MRTETNVPKKVRMTLLLSHFGENLLGSRYEVRDIAAVAKGLLMGTGSILACLGSGRRAASQAIMGPQRNAV